MKKILLLILTISTLLVAKEPSDCKEVVTQQFGNYLIKRKEFFRDHECILPSSEIIVNKETNQTIELDGFVTGIESTYLNEQDILKVNYHAGVHTNVVEFFTVAKNADLSRIEGGAIGSDLGDPAVYLDSFNNVLVVFQRYIDEKFHKGKPCRIQVEKVYEYKNNKFSKIVENAMMPSDCEE